MLENKNHTKGILFKKFENISIKVSTVVGSPYWFVFSVTVILIWIPTGFFIGFNELWHLHINTFTTIFTFLMMSLLHASQRKWEKRMEELQKSEDTKLKSLTQETERIIGQIPQQ